MTTSKFITYLNLTFLSDVNLSHLQNTRRKFIPNSDSKFLTLHLGIHLLVLTDEVHNQLLNKKVSMLIISPAIWLDTLIIKVLQCSYSELASLRDNLCVRVVFNTFWNLIFCQLKQLINQEILQVIYLSFLLFVNLSKNIPILTLALTSLNSAAKEFLIDNNTTQWWVSLQWRILNVTSLVTKDSTEKFLFWWRITLALRRNLTYHDITWLYTSTDTDNTIIVKILCSFFAHVRNVSSELLNATLCFTNFKWILINMNRSQNVFTNHSFGNNDSILIVITFPWHISHNKVTTQCQLTILCSVTLCEDISLLHTLPLITNRTKVYNHILVSATELRNTIFFQSRLKAYKLLIICTIIENTDCCSINILDNTIAFCCNHSTWIFTYLLLKTCTNDRCIIMKQRNSLTHHVTSHQSTVTIIMLQEWNQTSWYRRNLLWRNINKWNRIRSNNWIVSILTTLNDVTNKCTICIQWSITLSDNPILFLFSC